MSILRVLSIAAALGFASAAYAQNQPDPYGDSAESDLPQTPSQQDTMEGRGTSDPSASQDTRAPRDMSPSTSRGEESSQEGTMRQAESAEGSARVAMAGQLDRHRVSKMLGTNVETSTGDSIGEVKDIVVDRNGKVTHALVSYGGMLGMGAKMTAVPWETLTSHIQGDRIVLEKERLESAPSFQEASAPNFSASGWSREVDQYWGEDGTTRSATGSSEPDSSTMPPDRG